MCLRPGSYPAGTRHAHGPSPLPSKGTERWLPLIRAVGSIGMVVAMAWITQPTWADEANPQAFLTQYCLDCHSADEPSGDREFTSLSLDDANTDTQLRLQEIIDQLTLKTMPPEDGEQPSDDVRLQAIDRLTKILARMRQTNASTGGNTVLRRLTKREYRNTVCDLLGIDMLMFDPTQEFPEDSLTAGFDNIGDQLVTSGFLLEKYLQAADACVEKAFAASQPARTQEWIFKDRFYQQPELARAHEKAFAHRFMVLYDHPRNDKPEGAYGPLTEFKQGVPSDGIYQVRVLAQALHRDTPYGPKAVFFDASEPFRMGIRAGDTRISDLVHTQPIEPVLAEAVITDNELKWYEFEVPLDARFTPRFTFENGQHDVRGAYARVFRHHRETLPEDVRDGNGIVARRNALVKHGQLPQIRIHEVQLRGPLDHSPRKAAVQRLLGGSEFVPDRVPALLESFVTRAFRRPVHEDEVARFVAIYHERIQEHGQAPLEAYQDALKAVLCSPDFLYFSPPAAPEESELADHAIAERLSYFLTSSMPDESLRLAADHGQLTAPDSTVLGEQAQRLLQLPESERFVADFLDSWLKLRALGSMPPDPEAFREYYTAGLQPEMKQETRLFVQDLINRNGSTLELLSAKHSFVNRDLAKLYGVADQVPSRQAGEFHRVVFEDSNRGGLLGHASVLTVSANGIETSPVVRGVWLLENILGTPPPPPPDDVPAIEPDVRNASTIREQLAKHRASSTCGQCHRKIDPLGFALEGFDPIGRTRHFYDKKKKVRVDTAGVLVSGESFTGPAELRELLLDREVFFVRTVTSRLLAHALGRHPEATDREAMDRIIAQVRDGQYPLRDLIIAVVTSELFRQR